MQREKNWDDPGHWLDQRFALITAAILSVILYGSLYPFHFVNRPEGRGALDTLLGSWLDWYPRADVIANVLLYVPLGFFAVQAFRGISTFAKILWVAGATVILSAGVELLQYYDLHRVTNMSDVYSNGAGGLLGAISGTLLHREVHLPMIGRIERRRFVVLLLLCWLGFQIAPSLLGPDLAGSWGESVARLFLPLGGGVSPRQVLIQFATWLVVALLFEALAGQDRGRWAPLWVLPVLLFARTLLAGRGPSIAEALGGALAALSWAVLLWRFPYRAVLVAVLFTAMVVMQGLSPYTFLPRGRHFNWVPFLSFIDDTREHAVRSFFEKTFRYGALVWLMMRAGWQWTGAVAVATALVLVLMAAQVYLPNRSAEITDPLMVLIVAAILKLMRERVPAG